MEKLRTTIRSAPLLSALIMFLICFTVFRTLGYLLSSTGETLTIQLIVEAIVAVIAMFFCLPD